MTVHTERFGTRHRAALGITEQTDAVVVVVSEENGQVSLVERARIVRNLNEPQLARAIRSLLAPDRRPRPVRAPRRRRAGGRRPRRRGSSDLGAAASRDGGRPPSAGRAPAPARRRRSAAAHGTRPAVRRLVGLVTYNWPLKLAAIVARDAALRRASSSRSRVQEFPSTVQIDADQPAARRAVIVGNLPPGHRDPLRRRSATPSARASTDSFQATIDLAGVDPDAGPTFVPVNVESVDPRFQVVDYEPRGISVQLDPSRREPGPGPRRPRARPRAASTSRPAGRHARRRSSVTGPASVVDRVAASRPTSRSSRPASTSTATSS